MTDINVSDCHDHEVQLQDKQFVFSKMQAEMKQEYKIMNFLRGLKDPELENQEIRTHMLDLVYRIQFGALVFSLIPTLICLFTKLADRGLDQSENLLMGLIFQMSIVVYATLELAERYRQMDTDTLNDRTLLCAVLQLLNSQRLEELDEDKQIEYEKRQEEIKLQNMEGQPDQENAQQQPD